MERVTITPEQLAAVNTAVESGNYATDSEVLRQAIRDFEMAEARRALELHALKADVAAGTKQINKARPFNVARIVKAGQQRAAKSR
ncbi:MAG: ribbon-helix-helix domain-containing protein [Hyphomicrobiaceae bacterium]|nr:type II toxin-antitoxin system ParD family antitoxin [Hyphomicrobiaceae bacterium]